MKTTTFALPEHVVAPDVTLPLFPSLAPETAPIVHELPAICRLVDSGGLYLTNSILLI